MLLRCLSDASGLRILAAWLHHARGVGGSLPSSTPQLQGIHSSACACDAGPEDDQRIKDASGTAPPAPDATASSSSSAPSSSSPPRQDQQQPAGGGGGVASSVDPRAVARSLLAQFDAAPSSSSASDQAQPSRAASARGARGRGGPAPGAQEPPDGSAPAAEPGDVGAGGDVVRLVLQAVENCKPQLKVKQFKTGNRVSVVPFMVHPNEQRSLAVRWILQAAKKRKEDAVAAASSDAIPPSLAECLATELLLAANKQGAARAKRDEMHRLAVENRNNMLR